MTVQKLLKFEVTRIGFDYDGVLSSCIPAQIRAYYLATARGVEVHIITKRTIEESDEVYAMAERLHIVKENVHFTNNGPKSPFINEFKITKFYDNQEINKIEIEANSNCKVILILI